MDTDTAEIVRWLRGRALLEEAGLTKNVLAKAADTIERLQKEMGLARKQRSEFAQSGLRLEAERDAALAEIERLKGEITKRKRQILGAST